MAELWGRLVCLGRSIDRTDSFESMKVLIDTYCLTKQLKEMYYSILRMLAMNWWLKEVGSGVPVIQKVHAAARSSSMEASDSNEGVVGFEEADDEVPTQDEMAATYQKGTDMGAEKGADKAVEKPPNIKTSFDKNFKLNNIYRPRKFRKATSSHLIIRNKKRVKTRL
ncbi:hypothetical protein Cgig2_033224 [Carnegiea gigantea]|uniref:Uncharacterized protein n=1 Tax=Carnegiea gigantea TaxID=171969 RepID=A0A9Q1K2A3_9CARY|nr:hypothetical protein Cgig2_033224 [Carnegiea gigantea]